MKKLHKLSILMIALILASSCQDEEGLNPPQPGQVTISASSADTRTVLDGNAVKWESGDEIALAFNHPTKGAYLSIFTTSLTGSASSADFSGTIDAVVTSDAGGYNENAYAVYPTSALSQDGSIDFTLPAEQSVRANGAIASGLNLTSSTISLSDIKADGKATATFHNALSILRFPLEGNVTSVTLTGTAPLAGTAPFVVDHTKGGRLVIDASASWSDKNTTVVLKPASGSECFTDGAEVNLLVLPGTHSSMTVKLETNDLGNFEKTSTKVFTFEASKYYTLDFNVDTETLVLELDGRIGEIENDLSDLEEKLATLGTATEKLQLLLDQIQSVALYSEFLNNEVYARYGETVKSGGTRAILKGNISMDYIIRPAKAAELLIQVCEESGTLPDVFSALVDTKDGQIKSLPARDVALEGDILSVDFDASGMDDGFYTENSAASLALKISDGNTEVMSDFANLVSKLSAVVSVTKSMDIPVMRDATVSIPYQYGIPNIGSSFNITLEPEGFSSTPNVRYHSSPYTGYVDLSFKKTDDLSKMSATLVITSGAEEYRHKLTFSDGGEFVVSATTTIGWIGGEAYVSVKEPHDYGEVTMRLSDAVKNVVYWTNSSNPEDFKTVQYEWIYETSAGNQGAYTVKKNYNGEFVEVTNPDYLKWDPDTQMMKPVDGQPEKLYPVVSNGTVRSAKVIISVKPAVPLTVGDLTYTKEVTITQAAENTSVDESLYYQNGEYFQLNTADSKYSTPLNIVILGDGYQKKDLQKGGKFERTARSAVGSLFNVEPFKSFSDRFNVYMVAYESVEEGIDVRDNNANYLENKNTYFETYRSASSTAAYLTGNGVAKVTDIVKNKLGLDTDAEYYRTIALVLSNTDVVAGSCGYPYRDLYSNTSTLGEPYASFAIAVLPANSTSTSGLIRHELGGHGFGRLGDEYEDHTYDSSDLESWHSKGFYRNVTTNQSVWNWNSFIGLSGYEDVGYIRRNNNYWCPSTGGIMYNNQGEFNAPSRQIIYERIIRQTEGANAYSWAKFLEYDRKNIK